MDGNGALKGSALGRAELQRPPQASVYHELVDADIELLSADVLVPECDGVRGHLRNQHHGAVGNHRLQGVVAPSQLGASENLEDTLALDGDFWFGLSLSLSISRPRALANPC